MATMRRMASTRTSCGTSTCSSCSFQRQKNDSSIGFAGRRAPKSAANWGKRKATTTARAGSEDTTTTTTTGRRNATTTIIGASVASALLAKSGAIKPVEPALALELSEEDLAITHRWVEKLENQVFGILTR